MLKAVSGLKNALLVIIIVVAGHVLLPPSSPGSHRGPGLEGRGPETNGAGPPPPPPFGSHCRLSRDAYGEGPCGFADHPSAPLCDGAPLRGASLRVLRRNHRAGADADARRAHEMASAEELYRFATSPETTEPHGRPVGHDPMMGASLRGSAEVSGFFENMSCGFAPPL